MTADTVTLVVLGGYLVLFFFWIYGIYAFARDLWRWGPRVVAAIRARLRGSGEDEEPDREERERQLY